MGEKIKLSGVPETMLQTVYARAKESRMRGAVHDAKTEEIVKRLDYDFSLADKDAAMHSGVIARTIVLDRLVAEWLSEIPVRWWKTLPAAWTPGAAACRGIRNG